jgi:predicted CXXCH cytochrome family protein
MEAASHTHAPVTSERRCLNCHDPHAGGDSSLLVTDMQTLCCECHDREIRLPDGGTLADIKQVLETGTHLHGPASEGNCAACHRSHGGDHFRMLRAAYPPGLYESFDEQRYALCFLCHDRQLASEATTKTHTGFRNGQANLHFVHVNRGKKGRTCRVCHQAHAGSNEKLIRESISFGGWELPIGFNRTEHGGRCASGCHAAYEYNRVTPMEYPTRSACKPPPPSGRGAPVSTAWKSVWSSICAKRSPR